MTETLDFRLADGTDVILTSFSAADVAALGNFAYVDANPAVTTAAAATKTGFAAMKLTSKSSGKFFASMIAKYAAVAADDVTFTVDVYTDAVPGTPMTLPANAHPVGQNCFVDTSGAGIAPTAGATAVHTVTAPDTTLGTAGVAMTLEFSGYALGPAPGLIPVGQTWYVVFSVTNTVAARAITQLAMSAQEFVG